MPIAHSCPGGMSFEKRFYCVKGGDGAGVYITEREAKNGLKKNMKVFKDEASALQYVSGASSSEQGPLASSASPGPVAGVPASELAGPPVAAPLAAEPSAVDGHHDVNGKNWRWGRMMGFCVVTMGKTRADAFRDMLENHKSLHVRKAMEEGLRKGLLDLEEAKITIMSAQCFTYKPDGMALVAIGLVIWLPDAVFKTKDCLSVRNSWGVENAVKKELDEAGLDIRITRVSVPSPYASKEWTTYRCEDDVDLSENVVMKLREMKIRAEETTASIKDLPPGSLVPTSWFHQVMNSVVEDADEILRSHPPIKYLRKHEQMKNALQQHIVELAAWERTMDEARARSRSPANIRR